jgi:hypothetical protein
MQGGARAASGRQKIATRSQLARTNAAYPGLSPPRRLHSRLRDCCHRGSRTAEKHDELAPSDLPLPCSGWAAGRAKDIPSRRGGGNLKPVPKGQTHSVLVTALKSAVGPFSDLGPRPSQVRLSLDSGNAAAASACRFRADFVAKSAASMGCQAAGEARSALIRRRLYATHATQCSA